MKKINLLLLFLCFSVFAFGQSGKKYEHASGLKLSLPYAATIEVVDEGMTLFDFHKGYANVGTLVLMTSSNKISDAKMLKGIMPNSIYKDPKILEEEKTFSGQEGYFLEVDGPVRNTSQSTLSYHFSFDKGDKTYYFYILSEKLDKNALKEQFTAVLKTIKF